MEFTANRHNTRFDVHHRLDHVPELPAGHVLQRCPAYGISNKDDFQRRHQLVQQSPENTIANSWNRCQLRGFTEQPALS